MAFDRPDVLNAFRPHTVDELLRVMEHAREAEFAWVIQSASAMSRWRSGNRSPLGLLPEGPLV